MKDKVSKNVYKITITNNMWSYIGVGSHKLLKEEIIVKWSSVELESSKGEFRNANGKIFKYITKDELLTKYPNGGYRIIGDMKRKECKGSNIILIHNGDSIHLFPFTYKIKWCEYIVGYIKVNDQDNDDTYVRVLLSSWTRAILFPFCIILMILILFLSWLWLLSRNYVPSLDNTAVSYYVEGVENKDPDNSIALPGISVIKAKNNNPNVQFPLYNPEGNQCYMKYNLYDEDGTLIFESGLIEPGKAVKEFTMKKSFTSGIYKIRIRVETRDINNYKVSLNEGEMFAELHVE